ncbi:MAG: alpha/beta hydrolase [Oscillospiraceae bacterium]|nr:alpha/beta hydrolase [Oscillospiraceae bacterium]
MKHTFTAAGKKVTVYPCTDPDKPIIYFNTFKDEGEEVHSLLKKTDRDKFTLVTINITDWDHDMSPWEIPPVFKGGAPCTGGADEYLKALTSEIVPQTEALLKSVSWRGLAGYSLAGLFAVYAVYRTDIFSKIGSISGSLWFTGFREFADTNEMKIKPDKMYFSIGDKENCTANPYLKTVRENTEAIEKFFSEKGVSTVFKLNPGNHYNDPARRTVDGILNMIDG